MALKLTSIQAREPPMLAISMLTITHHRQWSQTGLAGIHPFTKKQAHHIVRPLMLGILVTILTIIMIVVCLLMSLVVMMQRPKQEGLGAAFGGSLTDRMLGSGTTDFLQKATVYLGVLFFILALSIATMMAWDRNADREARGEDIKNLSGAEEAAEAETGTEDGAAEADAGDGVPSVSEPSIGEGAAPPAEIPPPTDIPAPEPIEGDGDGDGDAPEGEAAADPPAPAEEGDPAETPATNDNP